MGIVITAVWILNNLGWVALIALGLLVVFGIGRTVLKGSKLEGLIEEGERPAWLMYGDGECADRTWRLSDGRQVWGHANLEGPSELALVEANYRDPEAGSQRRIECRLRLVAPQSGTWSPWVPLDTKGPERGGDRPCVSVSFDVPVGKYAVAFRFQNLSGHWEALDGVTMIVSRPQDYEV